VSYIKYRLNNQDKAEDLAQDVFVRLIDYKEMLRPDTVKSFVYTIARNIAIDYLRQRTRRQEVTANMYEFHEIPFKDDIESKLLEKQILQLEQNRLNTFTPQRKIVYALSRYEEMSIEEISENLNIAHRTVENHLLVGRKMMREYIKYCV
jgi:RNA polymerase sigma-70 factor (ECF subfamily)